MEDHCPDAVFCADPFHVVKWATDALDEVRRGTWRDGRARARQEPKRPVGRPGKDAPARPATDAARAIKDSQFALWKNPENLTAKQAAKLEFIAKSDPRLHRVYLLKEKLRMTFRLPYPQAVAELESWISWARRCRIPEFAKDKPRIPASIQHGLNNGRLESVSPRSG